MSSKNDDFLSKFDTSFFMYIKVYRIFWKFNETSEPNFDFCHFFDDFFDQLLNTNFRLQAEHAISDFRYFAHYARLNHIFKFWSSSKFRLFLAKFSQKILALNDEIVYFWPVPKLVLFLTYKIHIFKKMTIYICKTFWCPIFETIQKTITFLWSKNAFLWKVWHYKMVIFEKTENSEKQCL